MNNLWCHVVTTKLHYQVGILSRRGYIDMLNLYNDRAVKLQVARLESI